jgi:hypothetical protein
MKENKREYLNTQSERLATSLLPGYEKDAQRALLDIGYDYDLSQFRGILDAVGRGDISRIPHDVDLAAMRDNMSVFTRYYHVFDILEDIKKEHTKVKEDNNYVQKYIVGTSSSIATVSGERALVLQNRLDRGTQNPPVRPPDEDMQYTAGDYFKQLAIGILNVPNTVKQVVSAAASTFDTKTETLENRIQKDMKLKEDKEKPKNEKHGFLYSLAAGGVKSAYKEMERDLRELVTIYDEQGDADMALKTLKRLRDFYLTYPQEWIESSPKQQQAFSDQLKRDAEWLWMGDNFVEASQTAHPITLAVAIDKRIQAIKAQRAYANSQTDLASRAEAQQRTTNEITAAGFYNKINERITAEISQSRLDLQSIYQWLAANGTNSVYVDAFDERTNRSMSDIIINFNTNGVTKYSVRLPNYYGFQSDFNLDSIAGSGIENITDALEAASPEQ